MSPSDLTTHVHFSIICKQTLQKLSTDRHFEEGKIYNFVNNTITGSIKKIHIPYTYDRSTWTVNKTHFPKYAKYKHHIVSCMRKMLGVLKCNLRSTLCGTLSNNVIYKCYRERRRRRHDRQQLSVAVFKTHIWGDNDTRQVSKPYKTVMNM